MRRIFLLSVLLGIFATPATAASPLNYGTLKLGGYFPMTGDMDNFDSGFNGEIALGHYFSPNVALEISVGYIKASGSWTGVDANITSYPILFEY